MKKIYFLVFLFLTSAFFPLTSYMALAQSPPQGINYQAVARDVSGNPIASQTVAVTFRIRKGSPTGTVAYRGTQNYSTNQFGLFMAVIGQTSNDSAVFSAIPWNTSIFFLQVIVNGNDMGTTQFISVPYSFHSHTADSITVTPIGALIWKKSGGKIFPSTITDSVGIGTNSPGAKLHVVGNVKIADGTQGTGKVLTSDAAGLASWQPPAFTNFQAFSTAGTFTFTVPAGVTKIMVEVWGGGGGGGDGGSGGGGGGGAGGYGKDMFTVSPATTYTVIVGAGGAGGNFTNGGNGGTSSFGSLISATGGTGGATVSGIGGTGGTSSATFNITGGHGGSYWQNGGVYNGGSAGLGGAGGVSGDGSSSSYSPTPGIAPGGGGGGDSNSTGSNVGAPGANGRVVVWW